ncbi:reverse transcriptase domain-containing protein [Tanacetum coccineum]
MADNRTMAQMLQAPIEGYEDAIVVPPINANNFELKQPLINLVQSNKFTGRQDPHNHLRFFNKVTSTFRHPEVPNTSVKLLLFPFSLDGEARDWLDKEPPRSILTWDDLVSKFINQYFPPSKTTYYRNEIITFYQKPNEAFNEAWERFKGLLRQCPHHGFSELHQLDTFYNSLNSNDQDALDSAAGGNFLDKMPQEGLAIIESKSKVRYSRSRANDSRVSTDAPLSNSSSSNNSFEMQQIAASLEDKMTIKMNKMMNEMKALVVTTPAPVKAVEERGLYVATVLILEMNAKGLPSRCGVVFDWPIPPMPPSFCQWTMSKPNGPYEATCAEYAPKVLGFTKDVVTTSSIILVLHLSSFEGTDQLLCSRSIPASGSVFLVNLREATQSARAPNLIPRLYTAVSPSVSEERLCDLCVLKEVKASPYISSFSQHRFRIARGITGVSALCWEYTRPLRRPREEFVDELFDKQDHPMLESIEGVLVMPNLVRATQVKIGKLKLYDVLESFGNSS